MYDLVATRRARLNGLVAFEDRQYSAPSAMCTKKSTRMSDLKPSRYLQVTPWLLSARGDRAVGRDR